jgi:hypothetical protein
MVGMDCLLGPPGKASAAHGFVVYTLPKTLAPLQVEAPRSICLLGTPLPYPAPGLARPD